MLLHMAGSLVAPAAEAPLVSTSTAKSFHAFESCFSATQARQSRPFWVVPHADGGRISNHGADSVSNPYRIRFTIGPAQNIVTAFIGRPDAAEERRLLEAMKSC